VTSEDRRVQELVQALGDDDLPVAGEIMSASHESLARDFECSTPEVDALVDSLQRTPGVFGARMTGGGFGGAVVALCEPGAVRPDHWPGRAWLAVPSAGATVVADGPLVSPGRGPQPTRRPGPPGTP